MEQFAHRVAVLFDYGASLSVVQELLAYSGALAKPPTSTLLDRLPLRDEPHIEVWSSYANAALREGAWPVLRQHLVQLRFPIRTDISQHPVYQQATRQGVPVEQLPTLPELELCAPERITLNLHPTAVGMVPLITVGERDDFVALIQALVHSNEPVPVAESLGAVLIKGYVNWDRVRRLRQQWEVEALGDTSDVAWAREVSTHIKPFPYLYQDSFIIVSSGGYSAVPAAALGLDDDVWHTLSLQLRVVHESTHYLAWRLYGSVRNHLFDELIADYCGIVATRGRYSAEWALHFLGMEAFPACRPNGRLHQYRGQPPLSSEAFALLQRLVQAAVENLERFDQAYGALYASGEAQARLAARLMQLTLEDLAAADALVRLQRALAL